MRQLTHWESGLSSYSSLQVLTYPLTPLIVAWLWMWGVEPQTHKNPCFIQCALRSQPSHLESNHPCWDYIFIIWSLSKGLASCFVCLSWEVMKLCPLHNALWMHACTPLCLDYTCRLNTKYSVQGWVHIVFFLSPWTLSGVAILPMGQCP